MNYISYAVKKWFTPYRLLPLLTILGAGIAIVFDLLKIINLTTAEQIIIALLALIAIDALNERLTILEKIETKLSNLSVQQTLMTRSEMLSVVEHGKQASEMCLLAVHATSVIAPNLGFLKGKLQTGCKIRIILLDPEADAVQILDAQKSTTNTNLLINSSLTVLEELINLETSGKCEIRLLGVFLPFSMLIVDPSKETGSMTVEYRAYKLSYDERPHISLKASNNPYWFDYYKQQFELAWSQAMAWNGFHQSH